jgi:DNA-binding MarR family transcriptional regulator
MDDVTVTPVADGETAPRLRTVVGRMSRRLAALARGSGLTQTQLSVLGVIARKGPIRLSDLAEAEGLHQTMLSRVVAVLEEQELVRRRPSPTDRRSHLVETTAAGRRTHDRLRRERGRMLADALAVLPPAQVRAIEAALPALEALSEAVARDRSRAEQAERSR